MASSLLINRQSVDPILTCYPSPSLISFAVRSSEVRRLLLDLDPYWLSDPLGMFPFFLRELLMFWPAVFRRPVRLSSFPACWRQANATPIPKGLPSFSVVNYRPIYITSVLSKVFERLVSVYLGRFMERRGLLPTIRFAYRKGLSTCDALLCVSHALQSALEGGREAWILQNDFSTAIERVNHRSILYKLCSVGILGSVLSILIQFLSNRSHHVMVDGCSSKLVNVVSGVPQSSVFWGPFIVPPIHLRAFFHSGE